MITMKKYSLYSYQFNELSEKAKEKTLNDFRYTNVDYHGWWAFTYDDFCHNVLPEYGITADPDDINFTQDNHGRIEVTMNINEYGIDIKTFLDKCGIKLPHQTLWDKWGLRDSCLRYHIKKGDFYIETIHGCGPIEELLDWEYEKIESTMNNLLKKMANQLEEEFEWLTSDECVTECIEAGEYEFTVTGDLLPVYAQEA